IPRNLKTHAIGFCPPFFISSASFGNHNVCLALADLGASINLMPLSMWYKLSLPDLSPTCMTLELADRSISRPVGVAEDVFIKVVTFHFLADFVVVDFDVDPRVPLILERSFLKTERALIDVFKGELTLHVGKEAITFNLDQTSRYSANYSDMTANRITVIDMACEEYSQEVLGFSDVIASGNPTPYYDPIVSTISPTLTPFENIDFLLEEVDAFLALEDDLTSPEVDQSYLDSEGDMLLLEAFLNDDPSLPPPNQGNYLPEVRDDKLPVITAKDLSVEEKTALITVLKSHKRAIAWKLSDIKVVENEENELIPTRLVMGWRVCIDYRKLNEANRKDHFPLPFMDQMLERLARNQYYYFLDGFSGFIEDFSKIARPMTRLLKKDNPFLFSKECVEAFQTLKRKITEAPIFIAPDWDMPFELMCDASDFAIDAVLGQHQEKYFRPIHYATYVLCVGCGTPLYGFSPCQWCTCERCGNDLRDGFCLICNSRNSCVYDPNPNSFDCPPNSYHPPHPTYETYSSDSCGNDSNFGYDCPPQFPLNYEPELGYIENYNSYPYDSSSFPQQYSCCTRCGSPHETCQCDQLIFDEPHCKNCGGPHMNFQCQPMNPNFYNSNSLGFDQTQPPQSPVIHQPPQEMSIQEMEDLKQQYFDEMKCLINSEYRDEIKIDELKGNFNSMSIEINKKEKLLQFEQLANLSTYPSKCLNSFCYDDDNDEDYTIAATLVLSTEEPDNSLSIRDEHLDTIPATESDEVIKSSVEDLVPIPSEFEGIPDTLCDVHLVNNPTPLEAKDHFEIVINSNDDYSSSDDDYLYNENIEYIKASHYDSKLISLEVAKIVIPEDEEIEDDNLREKLLKVNLLIAKIEALKDNPTPSSEFLTKSSSTSPISFLEKTNTFDDSIPELENFCFDLEEISSGNSTIHSDISLSDY
nr:reverse transcriptase domain-containing protein [Tanacetum cinerariifolium]